jgi:hypothetical protein
MITELAMDQRTSDALWGAGIIVVLVAVLLIGALWGRGK